MKYMLHRLTALCLVFAFCIGVPLRAQVANVSVNSTSKVFVSPTAAQLAAANPLFVITSGSYADPAWVTSLASSKLTGLGTGVPAALAINTGSTGSVVLFNGNVGTPSALVGTNISGTGASFTAGHVTTNANLTGIVTSVGNATSIADGAIALSKLATAPVTSVSGTANEITSTGGATPTLSLPSAITFTGKTVTGGTFNSPALVTPSLGVASVTTLTFPGGEGDPVVLSGDGSGNLLLGDTNAVYALLFGAEQFENYCLLAPTQISFVDHSSSKTVAIGYDTQSGSYTVNIPAVSGNCKFITTADSASVTNTMLAGSIANAKLSNSAITIAGTSTSLGGSITFDAMTPSQTSNSGKYLTTNGTTASWGTVTVPTAADPTASVGLSAVNGSASTFMRSDGAPALSVAIVPTWTGIHTFASAVTTGVTTASGIVFTGNSLTTGTGIYVASSSLTSGKLLDLQMTGNGPASGSPSVLNIALTGANTTNAITTTGATLSNTRTNATSGTNEALVLTASGATTNNYALRVTTGQVKLPAVSGNFVGGAALLLGTTACVNSCENGNGFGCIIGDPSNGGGMALGYYGTFLANYGRYSWSSASNASPNNAAFDTVLTRASAGVVQVGTTDNNALGSLLLTNLTASGTITNSTLTASKPVFTDASKVLVSGSFSVPQIVASGNATAQSAANTSVATYTTPNDSTVHSFRVGGYANITAISAGTLTIQVSFTDETGGAQTLNYFGMGLTSAGLTATGFTGFSASYIRCNPNTAITFKTTFTGVSITYDIGSTMESLY